MPTIWVEVTVKKNGPAHYTGELVLTVPHIGTLRGGRIRLVVEDISKLVPASEEISMQIDKEVVFLRKFGNGIVPNNREQRIVLSLYKEVRGVALGEASQHGEARTMRSIVVTPVEAEILRRIC